MVLRAEVAAKRELTRVVVALARQWTGSKKSPLDPERIVAEVAGELRWYGLERVYSDGWGADALKAIARRHDLELRDRTLSTGEAFEAYDTVRTLLTTGRLELANHPALVHDLKSVRKVALANGLRIDLPKTADGRHCDFAPALAMACRLAPRAAATAEELSPAGTFLGSVGVGPGHADEISVGGQHASRVFRST